MLGPEAEVRFVLGADSHQNPDLRFAKYFYTFQIGEREELFLQFDRTAIKNIYCGLKMTDVNQSILTKILRSHPENKETPIEKVSQSKKCYGLKPFVY